LLKRLSASKKGKDNWPKTSKSSRMPKKDATFLSKTSQKHGLNVKSKKNSDNLESSNLLQSLKRKHLKVKLQLTPAN